MLLNEYINAVISEGSQYYTNNDITDYIANANKIILALQKDEILDHCNIEMSKLLHNKIKDVNLLEQFVLNDYIDLSVILKLHDVEGQNGERYYYNSDLLNPYMLHSDLIDDEPINEQWEKCDGEYKFKIIFDEEEYSNIGNEKHIDEEKHTDIKVCKEICKTCPFTKNAIKGYLGQDNNKDYCEDIMMMYEAEQPFVCHEHIHTDVTFDEIREKNIPLCRGYISMYRASAKIPRNPLLRELVNSIPIDEIKENKILKSWEFLNFHIGEK